jgi:Phospholipase A2
MSITNEIQGQIDYLQSEWTALSTLRHGCVCGAGDGGDPIDGLDTCCQAHDDGYTAVGHSADTMWTIDGLIKTASADRALALCAGGPDAWIDPDHEKSHPDPEGFRQRLIALFETRAWVGDRLAQAQAAGEWLGDTSQDVWDWANDTAAGAGEAADEAVESFKEWIDWAATQISAAEPAPAEVRAGFEEHVAYLASLGVSREQVDATVREAGVSPEQLDTGGVGETALA